MLKKDIPKLGYRYSGENLRTFDAIANVAEKIGVNKRPYIMIGGKVK